jgi:pimeloyl-ACP methyl ester carboxylesterase
MKRSLKPVLWSAATVLLLSVALVAINWTPDLPLPELRQRWAMPPSTFIEVDGMQVHLRDEGPRDDPLPIVLLHGTSASLHTWDGWAAALAPQRRVVRFDLPGFGLTGPFVEQADDYRLARYVRFIDQLLDQLALPRVVLAGNSFGGQLALATCLAHPQRVDKLILVDAAGYAIAPTSLPLGFRLARLPAMGKLMEVMLPRSVIASSVRNVYGNPALVSEALIDRYYQLTLRAGNRRALAERIKQVLNEDTGGPIAQIKVPTLILWGGRDRLIPPASAHRFAQDISGSRLVMFDELGHVPQEEDPLRTVAIVKAFLQPQSNPGAIVGR